jgi:hypothetical protein
MSEPGSGKPKFLATGLLHAIGKKILRGANGGGGPRPGWPPPPPLDPPLVVMSRYIELSIYRVRYRYIVSYRYRRKNIDFFDLSR